MSTQLDPRGAIEDLTAAIASGTVTHREVAAVIEVLRRDANPTWRVRAVDVLKRVEGFSGPIASALIAALRDDGMEDGPFVPIPATVSEVAAHALEGRRKSARNAVIAGMSTGPPRQRRLALRWLTPDETRRRIEKVLRALGDAHPMVSSAAAARIAEHIGNDQLLAGRVARMVRSDDARSSSALAALTGLTPEQAEEFAEVLFIPVDEQWSSTDQQRAAKIVGRVAGIVGALDDRILDLAVSDDPSNRRRAVLLAGSGDRRALLELLLDDPELEIRKAAREQLHRVGRRVKTGGRS